MPAIRPSLWPLLLSAKQSAGVAGIVRPIMPAQLSVSAWGGAIQVVNGLPELGQPR